MRKPCSILLLCVLLGVGASVVVPAEDVPETAYDESEALAYVSASFSIAGPKVITTKGQIVTTVLHFGPLRRPTPQRFDQRIDFSYPFFDSLTILDHSLRC